MIGLDSLFARRPAWGWALAVVLCVSMRGESARAVVVAGTNGNLSAPTAAQLADINGGSSFDYFNNVGLSSTGGAGFTYLGNGWCLTANHVTISNSNPHLSVNTGFIDQSLTITGNTTYQITTPTNPNVDLKLFHVDQVPSLPAVTISSAPPPPGTSANSQVIMVGNGVSLQADGNGNPLQSYWNNVAVTGSVSMGTSSTTPPASITNPLPSAYPGAGPGSYQASGYNVAGGNIIRWGTNLVSSNSFAVSYSGYSENMFYTTFNNQSYTPNEPALNYEAQATTGDSGGGVFHYNTATSSWELAGIMAVIDSYGQPTAALYGDNTFIVDRSAYRVPDSGDDGIGASRRMERRE